MNILIASLIARIVSPFVKVKKYEWVFSSDFGKSYRESSKYLFEYMCKNHPEFHCTYVVRNINVYNEIKAKGLPVVMNYSWQGIKTICRARCVFTSQYINDIHFAFKKNDRLYFYLNHGQSLKKQMKALELDKEHFVKAAKKQSSFKRWLNILNSYFSVGYTMDDVEFISANSEFFLPYLRGSYGDNMNIKILGMPRNDALFKDKEMACEKWLSGLNDKFIVTYMPTHRKYGKGSLSPIPFCNNKDIQKWLFEHDVVLLMKQHPNMIPLVNEEKNTETLIDITCMGLDPQVVIYHSDVLISDYSSVWLDYLLLRRPLVTYLYDDFERDDAGVNFNARKDTPGYLCETEEELFELIKKIYQNYDAMKPRPESISKFYKDADGNACVRYYDEIVRCYYAPSTRLITY